MIRAIVILFCFLLFIPSFDLMALDQVLFDAFREFPLTSPTMVCMADFNADGIQDLAVTGTASATSYNISVLIGEGDGTFQDAVAYSFAEGYERFYSLIADDTDNDGDVDIIAACHDEDALVVMLNDGSASFSPGGEFATEYRPEKLCRADFNGDGDNDIAVLYDVGDLYDDDLISIFLSNGDGTFQPALTAQLGWNMHLESFCTSDFDADGAVDIAVTDFEHDKVIMLFGNGDGTLQPAGNRTYNSGGEGPVSVAAEDFDLDGDVDLAIANNTSNDLSVLLNEGDGSFKPGPSFDTGWDEQPVYVVSSDLDGNGAADLILCGDGNNGDCVIVFLGDGDGDFQRSDSYRVGIAYLTACTGDVDLDGDDDVVVTSAHGHSKVVVLLNDGDGTFPALDYLYLYQATNIQSSDFDGDGHMDVAAIWAIGQSDMAIFLGNGDGTLQHFTDFDIGPDATSMCIDDFNGDDIDDLAVINSSSQTVSAFLGDGDGTFQPRIDKPIGRLPQDLCSADFNSDGMSDLAVTNITLGSVTIMFGNGDGTFQDPAYYATTNMLEPYSICSADFDGDGDMDIAVGAERVTLWGATGIMMNNGDGTFDEPEVYHSCHGTRKLAAADLDRDGDTDLVGMCEYYTLAYINNGDGLFTHYNEYLTLYVQSICLADFNHDRNIDIAAAHLYDFAFLMGNGDGTFQDPQLFFLGLYGNDICVSDFNGDDNPDLAASVANDIITTINRTPVTTSAETEPDMPMTSLLSQNFPNPFNPLTTLRFSIPRPGLVRIAVYDVAGRRLAVLVERFMEAGDSEVTWNGRDDNGRPMNSGVYFARMTIDNYAAVRKIILLR